MDDETRTPISSSVQSPPPAWFLNTPLLTIWVYLDDVSFKATEKLELLVLIKNCHLKQEQIPSRRVQQVIYWKSGMLYNVYCSTEHKILLMPNLRSFHEDFPQNRNSLFFPAYIECTSIYFTLVGFSILSILFSIIPLFHFPLHYSWIFRSFKLWLRVKRRWIL